MGDTLRVAVAPLTDAGTRRQRPGSTTGMAACEVCGNEYDKAFQVTVAGSTHTFDSFECAIHALAPACAHCECRIIGHGVEAGGQMFCCANCARHAGAEGVADRV
jgi:hypothetical protein